MTTKGAKDIIQYGKYCFSSEQLLQYGNNKIALSIHSILQAIQGIYNIARN